MSYEDNSTYEQVNFVAPLNRYGLIIIISPHAS